MPGIPICVYKPAIKKFLVTVARGKAFYSGGFGVIGPSLDKLGPQDEDIYDGQGEDTADNDDGEQNSDEILHNSPADENPSKNKDNQLMKKNQANKSPSNDQNIYLFLEEVIYLNERGLLQVFSEFGDQEMEQCELFQLLEEHDVSLSSYLTYAHLRTQTFIVLRHYDRSIDMREIQSDIDTNKIQQVDIDSSLQPASNGSNIKKRKRTIKRDIMRERAFQASPPILLHSDDDSSLWVPNSSNPNKHSIDHKSGPNRIPIAFDVYKPNSNFKRSDPGLPNYHVAVMDFGSPSPPFKTLLDLINICGAVPLRVATVSDSGTVVMFSIANGEVPFIASGEEYKTEI